MHEHDEPVKALRRDSLSPGLLRPQATPPWRRRTSKIAAALLVAVGGVSWGVYQQARIHDLTAPQSISSVVALVPDGELTRGVQNPATLPANTRSTLILTSGADSGAFRRYDVGIRDRDGKLLIQLSNTKRGDDGAITVFLPEGLPEGYYRLQAVGTTNDRTERLEYSLSVRLQTL